MNRMKSVAELRAELGAMNRVESEPDLDALIARGHRIRVRRRIAAGVTGVAVAAIAATPALWFASGDTGSGPALSPGPTADRPTNAPSPARTTTKPGPLPATALPPNCAPFQVCTSPDDRVIKDAAIGEVVDLGAWIGANRVVMFAFRPASRPLVQIGYRRPDGGIVTSGQRFGPMVPGERRTAIRMYVAGHARSGWSVVGEIKRTASSVTVVMADGRRLAVRRTTMVANGYTHFWITRESGTPLKVEAVTPAGKLVAPISQGSVG